MLKILNPILKVYDVLVINDEWFFNAELFLNKTV